VPDDDDIRAALRRGDVDGTFELLMGRYESAMFDRAVDVLRDAAAAQDAVQTAMIKVLRSRDVLDNVRNLRGWLLQVATNAALDIWRTGKRQRTRVERFGQQEELEATSGLPAMAAEERGRERAALDHCLGELDPVTRAAFLRRHQDEASWDEIAREHGLEVDAVRMRVRRALKGLRRCLARQEVVR
jgi:RNA polymerase sigma-70 factor (ECF subfamily)